MRNKHDSLSSLNHLGHEKNENNGEQQILLEVLLDIRNALSEISVRLKDSRI